MTAFVLLVFVTDNVAYLHWKLSFYLLLFCVKEQLFVRKTVFFERELHFILYLNVTFIVFIIVIIDKFGNLIKLLKLYM